MYVIIVTLLMSIFHFVHLYKWTVDILCSVNSKHLISDEGIQVILM